MNKIQILDNLKKYQPSHLIDMTRGKPCQEQLDLSLPMMDVLSSKTNYISLEGLDVRSYGGLTGIKECRKLMGDLMGMHEDNVIIFGNSSLNAMFDQLARSMLHGVCGGTPLFKQEKIKWLCPVPGYDRHFAMCEYFGIEMININMDENGPDMDKVEEYVKDPSVKGIWCVPKYSNPSGITYSNEVVTRFAKLKPASKDFRIYWDNAYVVHDFDEEEKLLNIFDEAKKYNNEDIVYIFTSTSKISFPGGGIAALGASKNNIEDITNQLKFQTISYDKVNELRHVLFFKDINGIKAHMKRHASITKNKFDIAISILEKEVKDIASWNKPKGGYFITLKVNGIAKQVVDTCLKYGVKLTEAGATHPYHKDEENAYIRIAPTCVKEDELEKAIHILCLVIKLETLNKGA